MVTFSTSINNIFKTIREIIILHIIVHIYDIQSDVQNPCWLDITPFRIF